VHQCSFTLSDRLALLLQQRCRGIDNTIIEDDFGALPKSVSVESSHRQNSVTNSSSVFSHLYELFLRLSKLLDERKMNSEYPCLAHPTLIRITLRNCIPDKDVKARSLTMMKQSSFNGKSLLQHENVNERVRIFCRATSFLVEDLLSKLSSGSKLNITRINVGTSCFPDLKNKKNPRDLCNDDSKSIDKFFQIQGRSTENNTFHTPFSQSSSSADSLQPSLSEKDSLQPSLSEKEHFQLKDIGQKHSNCVKSSRTPNPIFSCKSSSSSSSIFQEDNKYTFSENKRKKLERRGDFFTKPNGAPIVQSKYSQSGSELHYTKSSKISNTFPHKKKKINDFFQKK